MLQFTSFRERAFEIHVKDLVPSNRVSSFFPHTYAHPINTKNRREFFTVKHESTMMQSCSVKHEYAEHGVCVDEDDV